MGAIQLNHFLTDLHKPGQTPFEVLEKNISTLKLKSIALNVLEKICYVALIAIIAAVFAVSYNLLAVTGLASMVVTGLILTSPLLVLLPTKLAQWRTGYSNRAKLENSVYLKLKEIEKWETPDIQKFLTDHKLNVKNQDALKQVNPEEPLKALLPLIARFNSMKKEAENLEQANREGLQKLEEGFQKKEKESGKLIDAEIKQKIRYESRCSTQRDIEVLGIPYAINAATILHIIENPTNTNLDITPLSLSIPNLGECKPRSYGERVFAKITHTNDDYLVFYDKTRPSVTHSQILQCVGLDKLHLLLYPPGQDIKA